MKLQETLLGLLFLLTFGSQLEHQLLFQNMKSMKFSSRFKISNTRANKIT